LWLHSLKVAQLLRSAACLHTNQSRSYLNHLVHFVNGRGWALFTWMDLHNKTSGKDLGHTSSNLVNETNLVHTLFLVYLSISTCFGRLWAHHQEKKLYLCDTWYLLFCMDDYLVCRMEFDRITSNKCRINTVLSPDDWPIVARNT